MTPDPVDPIIPNPTTGPETRVGASNAFPNRPEYRWRCEAWLNWQSGTRVSLHVELHVDGDGGTWSSYDKSSWEVYVQGSRIWSWHGGFDFRSGNHRAIFYGDVETNVYNDGRIDVDSYATYDILGSTNALPDVYGTPPTTPPAPTQHQPTNVTINSMQSTFTGNGDGGTPITSWQQQWATDANFTQNVVIVDSSGTTQLTGLTPGTTYWIRSRGHNAMGSGGWSNVVSQATLPSVPPGLKVSASPSGAAATLTFSPPGGVSGVTKYTWNRRVTGSGSVTGSGDSTVITTTVPNLTPGASYDWRASAWIGTYQTPWSSWITLVQPKPNTEPGDYFDGSTADAGDVDYGWTGTADQSTSVARAPAPQGWDLNISGGAAVMMRATAGIVGTYAARVIFTADCTTHGQHFGQGWEYASEVTEEATYVGSIYVRPSRSQHMAAFLVWRDVNGTMIGTTTGAASVVPGKAWFRLGVGVIAPEGARSCIVRAIDVGGGGWTPWLGGESCDLDAAMISLSEEFPYFDGSTPYDGVYTYAWTDPEAPHASTSTRTPVLSSGTQALSFPDDTLLRPRGLALVDPDCAVVPEPPRPPVIENDCVDEVGIWRRYYSAIPSDYVSEWLAVVPTLEIQTGSIASRQLRIRYYENPDNLPSGSVPTSTWVAEQIVSYLPPATLLTLDGVGQRAWAEVNGSDPIGADHLLYGTKGQPASWPILSCGIAYLVSVDVPIAELPGNVVIETYLTMRT
jgi:hypothetical protein